MEVDKLNKPYWSILTNLLIKREEITTGLTIPYLFGAYKILGYQLKDIKELLTTILNSTAKEYPVIQKCDKIKFDVIKLTAKEVANRYEKSYLRIPSDKTKNILFRSYNTQLGNDLDKISVSLSALYQNPINEEKFSWSQGEKIWKSFEPSEIKLIQSIK